MKKWNLKENFGQVVKKPQDESFEDWLAVHVVDFFNRVQVTETYKKFHAYLASIVQQHVQW